jgi:hypothetical protein
MSGLSPDAKQLIAECRGQSDPSREDRARLHARLAPTWAAYEQQQALGATASARSWWSASATRWLLCVSLAWLGQPAGHTREANPARPLAVAVAASAVSVQVASVSLGSAQQPLLASPQLAAAALGIPGPGTSEQHASAPEPAAPLLGKRGRGQRAPQLRAAGIEPGSDLGRTALAAKSGARTDSDRVPSVSRAPQLSAAVAPAELRTPVPQLGAASVAPRRTEVAANLEPLRAEQRAGPALPERSGPQFVPQPIGDELELLGVAQDALRKQQPSVALRLVQQHAFRFPRGALTRERQAVQTLALCALQRFGPARAVFADLSENAPDSPMLESVRRACGF